MTLCLIRGAGDIGSAIAHVLFRHGHRPVLLDDPAPNHPRRGMAFIDAVYDGAASLEGVLAKRVRDREDVPYMLNCTRAIPVLVQTLDAALALVTPDVLVDARMRKRGTPEMQRGLARLTIGLGPNFVAGKHTDLAVETRWGDDLGLVIAAGSTKPLAGEPNPIEGIGRERYVYAPVSGRLETGRNIGDTVAAGEVIGRLDAQLLVAPIAGCIRGLTRAGAWVERYDKIIEIDPRGDPSFAFGIGERPKRIAENVLATLD